VNGFAFAATALVSFTAFALVPVRSRSLLFPYVLPSIFRRS